MLLEQTILDKLISKEKTQYYNLVEPLKLKAARRPSKGDLISIVIPTIGRWDLLAERALASIEKQTHDHFEVIVVCDGCKVPDWIRGLYSWVTWVQIPKTKHYPEGPMYSWLVGPSVALNVGLRYVQGDWIARIDDDDTWRPKMLETMLKFAEEGDYEFVSAAAKGPDGPIMPYRHPLCGSVQTWLYRSYLKCFEYNLDSWRKSWDRPNEIDLYKRMHKAGVRFGFKATIVSDINPRPGVKTIGSSAWVEECERKTNEGMHEV